MRKSKYSCRGRPESLLREPMFTACFPRRHYLRINLFHRELIQSLLLRALPRRLEPLRDGRRGRCADNDLLVLGNGSPQQAFDSHLLLSQFRSSFWHCHAEYLTVSRAYPNAVKAQVSLLCFGKGLFNPHISSEPRPL